MKLAICQDLKPKFVAVCSFLSGYPQCFLIEVDNRLVSVDPRVDNEKSLELDSRVIC